MPSPDATTPMNQQEARTGALAVMQPYLFPYLGYFQLLGAVRRFVFFDDVNFIKRGWINRNRLLNGAGWQFFTVPLAGASQFQQIGEVRVLADDGWRRKLMASVRHTYAKAPNFKAVNDIVASVVLSDATHIGEMAKHSVVAVAKYLGLPTEWVWSSTVYGHRELRGAERILEICRSEGASRYYNLAGGQALYDAGAFAAQGVELRFVNPKLHAYRQFSHPFQPGLSIIDVLMFNDAESVRQMLAQMTLSAGMAREATS